MHSGSESVIEIDSETFNVVVFRNQNYPTYFEQELDPDPNIPRSICNPTRLHLYP